MAITMKKHPLFKFFISLRLTVVLLSVSLFIIFFGTMAQEPMGLKQAVDRYFKSWFVDQVAMEAGINKTAQLFGAKWEPLTQEKILGHPGIPVFPGGYLIGTLLLINLVTSHYVRFEMSSKKAGIYLTHLGIITLLLGQLFTDIFQVESYLGMERGDRRNYTVSFDDHELAFIIPVSGDSNRVVSIPTHMLKSKELIQHPELKGLSVETERYWINAEPMTVKKLIDSDLRDQEETQKNEMVKLYDAIDARIDGMEEHLSDNPDSERREVLTKLKNKLFGQRGGEVDLDEVDRLLRGVGHMETNIYKYQKNDPKIIGNSAEVVQLMEKIKDFDFQRAIVQIFQQSEKDRHAAETLEEFGEHVDLFLERIRKFPGEKAMMVKATEVFSERIKRKAKLYYTGATKGKVGDHYMFVKQIPADLENDQNLPAAVIKINKDGKELGKWLVTSSFGFRQSLDMNGETWEVVMRQKRQYLDFFLTLVHLDSNPYAGTSMARDYLSRVIVEDGEGSRSVDIYMNNPLRNGGYTFYQSDMNLSTSGVPTRTGLQVVKNPNWFTAYVGCLIVSMGLLYQFLFHLTSFARKRMKTEGAFVPAGGDGK